MDNDMRSHIKGLLEPELPLVDLESDCLFDELDSLNITYILMTLASEYGIDLDATDVTPRNFMTLDSLTAMVEAKIKAGEGVK